MSGRNGSIKNHKETDEFKIPSTINIAILVLVFAVIGAASLLLSKPKVSEIEKRELAEMPKLSIETILKGEFSKQTDMFYSDTFPGRDIFVSFASMLKENRGVLFDDVRIHGEELPPQLPPPSSAPAAIPAENEPTDQSSSSQSSSDSGSELGEQRGTMFIYKGKGMEIFGGNNKVGKWYADTLNAYQAALGDSVQIYNVLIPTSIEFGLPEKYKKVSSPQKPFIDYIYENLDPKIKHVDAYSAIEKHRDEYVYFNTDHHWTGLGAYYAYCEFAKTAGLTPPELGSFEKRTRPEFLGTLYGSSQDSTLKENPDYVDYYMPSVAHKAYRYVKNEPFTAYPTTIMADYAVGAASYSVFLHGDHPLVRVDTENKNGRKVMIVKESFGNAFSTWLVNDYEQVFIVDQRYFQLGAINFIKENGINELIFINNIFAANTSFHVQKISNMMYQQFVPPPPPEPEPVPSEPTGEPTMAEGVPAEDKSSSQDAEDAGTSDTEED